MRPRLRCWCHLFSPAYQTYTHWVVAIFWSTSGQRRRRARTSRPRRRAAAAPQPARDQRPDDHPHEEQREAERPAAAHLLLWAGRRRGAGPTGRLRLRRLEPLRPFGQGRARWDAQTHQAHVAARRGGKRGARRTARQVAHHPSAGHLRNAPHPRREHPAARPALAP